MSNVWTLKHRSDFNSMALDIARCLLRAPEVHAGSWQSIDVSDDPNMVTHELRHARITMGIPNRASELASTVGANLPWAEDHFQERVSGQPLNPPPSEAWWPYAQQGNAAHKADQQFSHTYPERFWPKMANGEIWGHYGVRYRYGDLNDLIDLMTRDPLTRQAYLPVWFPEDTGSVEGQRVPCTLGYHFLMRQGLVDIEYHIRSCDFMRHWRDDIYMAGRLLQWLCSELQGNEATTHSSPRVRPGRLVMNIGSLHIFRGDRTSLGTWISKTSREQSGLVDRLHDAL